MEIFFFLVATCSRLNGTAACPIALQLCVGTPEKFRLHLAVVYAVGKVA